MTKQQEFDDLVTKTAVELGYSNLMVGIKLMLGTLTEEELCIVKAYIIKLIDSRPKWAEKVGGVTETEGVQWVNVGKAEQSEPL